MSGEPVEANRNAAYFRPFLDIICAFLYWLRLANKCDQGSRKLLSPCSLERRRVSSHALKIALYQEACELPCIAGLKQHTTTPFA
jgi:hypothetical protein